MRPILITGISGFIGGHVWAALASRDDVWGVHGATGKVPLRPDRQLNADFSNPDELARLVKELSPRCVLHLGAISRLDLCRQHSLLAWKINHATVREMARAAVKTGTRVIHISSDQVFDGTHGNYREGDPPNPLHVYGETKKASERAVFAQLENSVVVRLNSVYGPPRFRGGSFSEWILEKEARGETIPLYPDQHRSPIDVHTVSRALIELLDHSFTGLLHLGGANRVSRVTFGVLLLRHLGRDTSGILEISIARHDPEGHLPRDTSFDITLAHQVLTTPIPGVQEGLGLVYGPPKTGTQRGLPSSA